MEEKDIMQQGADVEKTKDEGRTKCKSCGGIMRYSPSSGKLKCVYCGSEQEIEEAPFDGLLGYDYEEYVGSSAQVTEETQTVSEVTCKGCGATVSMNGNTSSGKCPFCGSSLMLEDEQIRQLWDPQYIIPFKVEEKQGIQLYKKWLSGRWYAPDKLRKEVSKASALQGIYVPFWGYDASTVTEYTGERGDNYEDTVERNGKEVRVTRTEWSFASGTVYEDFENILVAASNTIPENLVANMEHWGWDLENCVAYKKDYVTGFVTELYKNDFEACFPKAQNEMAAKIKREVKRDIGGDKQVVNNMDTEYNDVKFKLIMLPVWLSSFRYNGKLYQFIVNGSTGEVNGKYPVSAMKVVLTVIIVIAVLALLYFLLA